MNVSSLTVAPLAFLNSLARSFGATSQVRSGFALTAVGAGSLGVTVAAGTAWVDGTYLSYAGGTVTPGAASATQPRYDLIVVLSGAVVPSIVAGTAADAPVPPALAAGALFVGLLYIGPAATDYTVAATAFIADYTMPIVNFAGTAAAPAMPFTGDLDTGWISPGDNRIQTVTGGVARNETTSRGDFVPVSTSIVDVGTSTLRWRDVNAVSVRADIVSASTIQAAIVSVSTILANIVSVVTDVFVGGVSLSPGLVFNGFRAVRTTDLTVPSTSAAVCLVFDVEVFDRGGMFATTSGARMTFPLPGVYHVGVNAVIDNIQNVSGGYRFGITRNGSIASYVAGGLDSRDAVAGPANFTIDTLVSLVSTDFLKVMYQNQNSLATAALPIIRASAEQPALWAYRVAS